ncbi:MAG: DNA translocase FtsK 4TM domain-containing protein, partial [Anaerolineae bacterium]|nr:DNA translocase FtsK 4TM domain-containing protein [Anaerolineae bacterium]
GDSEGSTGTSNRASTTRTIDRYSSGGTGEKPSTKSKTKKGGGRFNFSLPFGLGKEGSSAKKRQPSPPKGLKRSKPLPASSKRPQIKNEGLSLDLKLDLAGWAMVILSGIIFFGAISANQGSLSRTLLELIYQLVGIGWFAIPLVLAAAGIWLIWRHFGDSVPEADYVHIVGWGITYLAALTTFHFVHLLASPVYTIDQLQTLSTEAAAQGYGGGWVGGQFYMGLMRLLGDAGTFIALLGWWGIGLIVATDLSFAGIILFLGRARRNLIARLRMLRKNQVRITPIPHETQAEPEHDSLPAGRAAALNSPGTQRALPPAETMPIPQQERSQPPVHQREHEMEEVTTPASKPAESARPAAYIPPTQRASASQYRMPARQSAPDMPPAAQERTRQPVIEQETPETSTPDQSTTGPVTFRPGSGPIRIKRPQYGYDDTGDDDWVDETPAPEEEATGALAPPAPDESPVRPAETADYYDGDDPDDDENIIEVIRHDKPVMANAAAQDILDPPLTEELEEEEILPADDEEEEPDDSWMKPARPRHETERRLRPLRDEELGAAGRAALLNSFANAADSEDDSYDDDEDFDSSIDDEVFDGVVYEDLPDVDAADDELDVIEIDEPEIEAPELEEKEPDPEPVKKPAPAASKPAEPQARPPEKKPAPEPEGSSLIPPPPKAPAWVLPDYTQILNPASEQSINDDVLLDRARIIEDTLSSFGAPGKVVEVNPGPVITQFGVEPDYIEGRGGKRTRVKVQAIARLADDLALSLAARSIRIEAPVPGKGFVGIEVPNSETSLVSLRDVIESPEFNNLDSKLRIGLGQSVDGTPVAADLTAMPHLLIAGTTGSGKSVCVNAIIACLLMQNTPDDLRFIMVDPKRVELTGYNGIPHLVAPVVVELERIVGVLKWVTREMDDRYRKFNERGARNILSYNSLLKPTETPLPYLVVVIDELADLMMLAPDETERVLTRLAQMSRATGIHLMISTQRPSVDVVTGLIKANFPSRVAFAVASSVDSRVILDQPGAERLLGRGDMLFQAPDAAAPARLQGVYVSDAELNRLVSHWKGIRPAEGSADNIASLDSKPVINPPAARASTVKSRAEKYGQPTGSSHTGDRPAGSSNFWDQVAPTGEARTRSSDEADEMYDEAVEVVRRLKKASVSLLQRQLRIGYTRAARLIDVMEERGVVGPAQSGSKPRKVVGYSDDDLDLDMDEGIEDEDFEDDEDEE